MIIRTVQSKNVTIYYVQKSYRKDNGKNATKVVEKLGNLEDLKRRFGEADPVGEAKRYAKELTKAEKEAREDICVKFSPAKLVEKGEQRCFNAGYLYLQKVYHELGLDRICKRIESRHKNRFDINAILSMLLYTRVLYPGSKRSSLEDAKRFIEQPEADIHQVYRALSVLAEESDTIQAEVYRNSLKLGARNDKVVYYDCTNYYFETEEEDGLKQYGHSKESRPNPIVQMGLFTDMDGMPLAFCINPGNTAESTTLRPLEEKLKENFNLSRIVVCTDAGLATYENRRCDSIGGRSFVTVQSIKTLGSLMQDWATESTGWHIVLHGQGHASGMSEETYDISELDPEEHKETLFCKERWAKFGKKGNELEQRLIVTFSFKYRDYIRRTRNRQIERAEALLQKGGVSLKKRTQNDAKRFIKQEDCTADGELAEYHSYSLDKEMIEQEERFDGFYGICTNLEDRACDIIRLNGGRWIIEDCFRITKTEMEARPVYLHRDDRIKAHFLTCFLSLLLYKYLAKKINKAGEHFTVGEIIETLRHMDMLSVCGEGYVPTYTRTTLTNHLNASAGFRTDYQIITKKDMRSIIASTKK